MVLTSSQTLRVLVVVSLVLGIYAHYRLWHYIQSQKTLTKILVEQVKQAYDAIGRLHRKDDSPVVVVDHKPIVKDVWMYASVWVTFVQSSDAATLQRAKDLYVESIGPIDETVKQCLDSNLSADYRIKEALKFLEQADPLAKQKVVTLLQTMSKPVVADSFVVPAVVEPDVVPAVVEPDVVVEPVVEPVAEPVAEPVVPKKRKASAKKTAASSHVRDESMVFE